MKAEVCVFGRVMRDMRDKPFCPVFLVAREV